MSDVVKHRILGGLVLAILALGILPVLVQVPSQDFDDSALSTADEAFTQENRIVKFEEKWQEPTTVARVDLRKEQEITATEKVEAQPIIENASFANPNEPTPSETSTQADAANTEQTTSAEVELTPPTIPETPKPTVEKTIKVVKFNQRKQTKTSDFKTTPRTKVIKISKPNQPTKAKRVVRKSKTIKMIPEKAWAIQLASFKEQRNALELQSKLRKQGYHAFIRGGEFNGRILQKVFVGPEVSRQRAQKLAQSLNSQFRMAGLVVPYSPINNANKRKG